MYAMTSEEYQELMAYRKTGFTPKQINDLLNDPDEAPLPMIDDSVPAVEDFWNEN